MIGPEMHVSLAREIDCEIPGIQHSQRVADFEGPK